MSQRCAALLALALCAFPACTTKALPPRTGTAVEPAETNGLREEVAGARVELSSASEQLGALAREGAKLDPAALDAILERLERAEARMGVITERLDAIERGE